MAKNWYYRIGDKVVGPVSSSELYRLTAEGDISRRVPVRPEDRESWVRAEQIRGLFTPRPSQSLSSDVYDSWFCRDAAAKLFGPATKTQLDEWLADGRLTAECRLRHEDWNSWRAASEVYPELCPSAAIGQRISQIALRFWRLLRNRVENYAAHLAIAWEPAQPHLRRCVNDMHQQFTTHIFCHTCGAATVGVRVMDIINGNDRKCQDVFVIWERGKRYVARALTYSALVGGLLSVALLFTLGWSAIILIPIIVLSAIALPLVTAKIVNGRVNHRLASQDCVAPSTLTEEQVDLLSDKLILPFLRRNEMPIGTPTPTNAFVVRRLRLSDQTTEVMIETSELQMLHELLAREGASLWRDNHGARVVLKAISLKSDYALFKQRIQQMATSEKCPITAYASLVSQDTKFLPFLRQLLIDMGQSQDSSSLLQELTAVRHRLRLRGFEKDLEQRRHGSMMITLDMIDTMNPYNFELLLGMIYESLGYQVSETPRSCDQGADVLLERAGERTVIQAKLYSETVGNKAVQEAIAARSHFRCHAAKVVTNSSFTTSARELAQSSDVELVGREALADLLDHFNRSPKDYIRLAELLNPDPSMPSFRNGETI